MQNLAEFAQNPVMCTSKVEKSYLFNHFQTFSLHVPTLFMGFFGSFLCILLYKIVKLNFLTAQEDDLLEGYCRNMTLNHFNKFGARLGALCRGDLCGQDKGPLGVKSAML